MINNYIGIFVQEGNGDIQFNHVLGNMTNGIQIVNNSFPFISHNIIKANQGVGLLI